MSTENAHNFCRRVAPRHMADLLDHKNLHCRFCGATPLTTECAVAAFENYQTGCSA